MTTGESIIYIEDDEDDQVLLQAAIRELGLSYTMQCFAQADQALAYLKTCPDKPALILCDVNLPGMKGPELRKLIDADPQLRQKAIPFIFFSTEPSDEQINQGLRKPHPGILFQS